MKDNSYFIFGLNDRLYGISTAYVEEVFPLPEFVSIPEAPRKMIGVVNLRGEMIPVTDFNQSLGLQSSDYRLTDSVIVLRREKNKIGIIVNQVCEVLTIAPDEITTELAPHQTVTENGVIGGLTRHAGDILILSDPENWLSSIDSHTFNLVENYLTQEIPSSQLSEEILAKPAVFAPNATPEEREIFRERADSLKLPFESQDLTLVKSLTIIVLNHQLFGIDLGIVREFTEIQQVTPIPCCPPHIVGNMNLRGEIVTLVDIRPVLNLPLAAITPSSKALIVEVEEILAGVIVEDVRESMFLLNPLQIIAVTPDTNSINHEYLQGEAVYAEKIMSILDLGKVFLNGGLIVEQGM
ncbi:chemotaxis protein CheW [Coleofasciculus sp. G2-EDA-02]|uniref:chemotaxis protein CheW n=1 Tax=Coleofasciculus sp. G2-EDA-02 TaxID=3069529 RepID=UPI003300CCCC